MVLCSRASFPRNRSTQWIGLRSGTPSGVPEEKNAFSLSDPRERGYILLLPRLSKIPQGDTPATKQAIPASMGAGCYPPPSQLKPSATSLPLLHLPCHLSCPSDKPESQAVLSAWNILRSQDQGPAMNTLLHNPWGS